MKSFASPFLLASSIFLGGLVISCGEQKKTTPEEEVRDYGKYFVEKLAANQLDSLTASYPDIAKADSILPVQSDTIMLVEVAPGQYDMTLAEGITLKVNRSDDGNISVTESKGLFAFPADKVDTAKKTGMWDNNLSDVQLNERMKDEEFFKWLNKKRVINPSRILSIKFPKTSEDRAGFMEMDYLVINNLTDVPVSGKDYYLEDSWSYKGEGGKSKDKGKDIAPHGSVSYKYDFGFLMLHDFKIKWNLNPKQLQEKFASYTGKEYQEYLDSQK